MISLDQKPALLIIDAQNAFDEHAYWGGNRNNPQAEENIKLLLDTWRKLSLPVFHAKHNSIHPESPLFPGKPGNEIKAALRPLPSEPLLAKNVNSAFIGTDLQERLNRQHISQLVVTGFISDHCVATTIRMAGNLGFDTYAVADAMSTFDRTGINGEQYTAEQIHLVTLASLNKEFATIVNTQKVLALVEVYQKQH